MIHARRGCALLLPALLWILPAGHDARAQADVPPGDVPCQARPADVESVDAIIAALYDVISGPAAEPRDWDRMRCLFAPDARLIPVRPAAEGDTVEFLTVERYIELAEPVFEERGFFERELGRVTEQWEHIAHAFSSYESRWTPDEAPFSHGINSIQLTWDGTRWWVANIMWMGVGPDQPIPERYLERH